MKYLSTFSLAALLAPVVASLPTVHVVYGKGANAARVTTKFPDEYLTLPAAKVCKTEVSAKASLTRRFNSRRA
jgi:hypothetical protein